MFKGFTIERAFAPGAFTETVLARSESGERFVLKRLREGAGEEARAQFAHEAWLLGAMDGEGAPKLLLDKSEGPKPTIAMAYVSGVLLREMEAPSDVSVALRVIASLCDVLARVHAIGALHNDVAPENVLVDGAQRATLIDFGLATSARFQRRERGVVSGTAGYIAPERVEGEEGDGRSDVWSAAVLLFELLSGRRLYPGILPAAMLATVEREATDVRVFREDISSDIAALLVSALSRKREQRPQSATAMAARLRALAL